MSSSNSDRSDSMRYPYPDDKAHIRGELDLGAAEWHGRTFQWASVRHTDGETYVVLRRSKAEDAAVLIYTRAEWEAFGDGAAAGEFTMPPILDRRGQVAVGLFALAIATGLALWFRSRRARRTA